MSLCHRRLSKRRPAMVVLYALQTALERPTYGFRTDWRQLSIREVWIYDEAFAASRLSMMRIIARRTKAVTVAA